MSSYQKLKEQLAEARSEIAYLEDELEELRGALADAEDGALYAGLELIDDLLRAGHSGHWVSCPICVRQCIVSRLRTGSAA